MSDLISRCKLFNKLSTVQTLAEAYAVIQAMETEDAVPVVRGRWSGDFCSKCGISKYNFIKILHDDDGPFGTWNFCPRCGTDMRKDGEQYD